MMSKRTFELLVLHGLCSDETPWVLGSRLCHRLKSETRSFWTVHVTFLRKRLRTLPPPQIPLVFVTLHNLFPASESRTRAIPAMAADKVHSPSPTHANLTLFAFVACVLDNLLRISYLGPVRRGGTLAGWQRGCGIYTAESVSCYVVLALSTESAVASGVHELVWCAGDYTLLRLSYLSVY
ncbi:hypothetical protein J6590_020490 [Homalodisca vitripennis]|nr:hypothetical protein J6590_020490 [Homalodisca vitripennis]